MSNGSVETAPETKTSLLTAVPWHVVVYNDPVNLMPYVQRVFQKVFGYPKEKARDLMLRVHERGEAIVWTGARERAELYVQQLQGYQLLTGLREAS
jgi:ATP-dependent Clp protease adaptor protein ClpS